MLMPAVTAWPRRPALEVSGSLNSAKSPMPLTEQTQAMISGSEVLFNGA